MGVGRTVMEWLWERCGIATWGLYPDYVRSSAVEEVVAYHCACCIFAFALLGCYLPRVDG